MRMSVATVRSLMPHPELMGGPWRLRLECTVEGGLNGYGLMGRWSGAVIAEDATLFCVECGVRKSSLLSQGPDCITGFRHVWHTKPRLLAQASGEDVDLVLAELGRALDNNANGCTVEAWPTTG